MRDTPRVVAAVQAMQEAKNRFAFATAARFGELALELWEQVPDAESVAGMPHIRLMRQLGSILRNAGEAERALVVAERALAEVDERTDPSDHARLLRDRGFYLANLGREGAAELFLAALEIVDRIGSEERPGLELVVCDWQLGQTVTDAPVACG